MKKSISCVFAVLLFLSMSAWVQAEVVQSDGYALFSKDGKFKPYHFERHAVGDNDVLIDILYAGICHSDLHHAHGDWRNEVYPMVPGHEIVGRVADVGKNVTRFKVGDYAGVGCLVNSCGKCEYCKNHEEQYCPQRVLTYACKDIFHDNMMTQGGYSNNIVVSERFAIKVPKDAELEKVAPLFCAGITTYSPLKFTHVKKRDKVAVAGFGGLGHMALQYAVSLGAEVTVFDITEEKRKDALSMGAANYVNVNKPEQLKGLDNTFRVILSTIPMRYDPVMYLKMLQLDGELVILGLPARENVPSIDIASLVFLARRHIYGSQIGGIRETQEMLDYSVANHIYPRVEVIPIQQLDEAYRKVEKGEVKFRYVIDMSTLKPEERVEADRAREGASKAERKRMSQNKTLIAYYSWSDSKNTRAAAEIIQQQTGGDLFEIKKVKPYSRQYQTVLKEGKDDLTKNARPAIEPFDKSIASYDVVYIGSPIWFGTYAPPVSTFLTEVDMSGKTVLPFSTHGGGGSARYARDIAKLCPDSKVLPEFTCLGTRVKQEGPAISKWLEELSSDMPAKK